MDLARSRITIASDKQSDLDDPLSARLRIMSHPNYADIFVIQPIHKPSTIAVFVID
jgi:hypothetical protein